MEQKSSNKRPNPLSFNRLTVIGLLVVIPLILCSQAWFWNRLISLPAWAYLIAVHVTEVKPTHPLYKSYVNYVDWAATKLMYEPVTWEIPTIENSTPDDFTFAKLKELSNGFTRPVIFRGLGKQNAHLKDWADPRYFAERYGNTTLNIVRNPLISQQREAAINATEYGASDDTGVFSADQMQLSQAIERMLAGDTVYIQNVDVLVRRNPEIMEHMELSKVFKNWKNGKPYTPPPTAIVNWFLGFGLGDPKLSPPEQTTGTSLHCAMPANLFFQFAGKKQWWWVEPRWTPYILGTFNKLVPAGFARRLPSYVPKAEATLVPGDVMFNPSYMWHEVRNYGGWSLAAANRFVFPMAILRSNAVAYLLMDIFGNPFYFGLDIYKNKPVVTTILKIPLLRTALLLLQPSPVESKYNPTAGTCDEHNMAGCTKTVESFLFAKDKAFKK